MGVLIAFLLICLPFTWGLTAAVSLGGEAFGATPGAAALLLLASFMPAISAVICCVHTKEGIRSLKCLPRLQGNARSYLLAVLSALALSVLNVPFITVLFFPQAGHLRPDITVPTVVFQMLLYTAVGCVQFYVLMGEEVGWMGFLFPRLERLWGTNAALAATGLIRGLWHMGMFAGEERFAGKLLLLCLTNIVGGCLLVLLTKRSGSVVPAAVCHALNNTLPQVCYGAVSFDEAIYPQYERLISVLSFIPYLIFMAVCWYRLSFCTRGED